MEKKPKKLSQDEQEILKAFEQGEYISVLTEEGKRTLEKVARNNLKTNNT